jgi:hypothetical protein
VHLSLQSVDSTLQPVTHLSVHVVPSALLGSFSTLKVGATDLSMRSG